MGEVWRARHRMLARPAAIKLIRRSAARDGRARISEDARRRFEREAQVIASLRSPHTVGLFDFGVAQDGTFYYAMELLEGLDADTLVRRFGPVAPERVIYLLRPGLSLADRGRDVRPGPSRHQAREYLPLPLRRRIRFREGARFRPGEDARWRRRRADGARPALTQENVIQGTPAFMAPEQVLGGAPLDGRADIYATGCVAYWLLTGQPPLHRRDFDGTPDAPCPDAADTPVGPERDAHPRGPRSARALLPGQGPGGAATARELSRQLADIAVAHPWTEDRAREWWAKHRPSLAQG